MAELTKESLLRLIREVRLEYQIPPYFDDEGLRNYANEGKTILSNLNPGRDIDSDSVYRMLLKTYIYYAYHHRTSEWKQNYTMMILEWQLGSEVQDD